jgi:hypothetical protein
MVVAEIDSIEEETKSETEDTKPEAEDIKPVVEDTKPVVEDTKPAVEETKPAVEDTKPVVDSSNLKYEVVILKDNHLYHRTVMRNVTNLVQIHVDIPVSMIIILRGLTLGLLMIILVIKPLSFI